MEKKLNPIDIFRPAFEKPKGENKSGFYPKEGLFNKQKTYLKKGKTESQFTFDADWIKVCVSGNHLILHKGVEISGTDFSKFSKKEAEFYLFKKGTKAE